jgi:DinB superfamily
MPTREDYLRQPLERRLARLARTADELTEAIRNRSAGQLARRPEAASWSATEIICHLRDVEELFRTRFHTILALDDPKILTFGAEPAALAAWGIGGSDSALGSPSAAPRTTVGHPLDPDRWAEERQYARSDPGHALAAFRRHRGETVALLESLTEAQWQRGGIHLRLGRLTLGDWVASLAGHDDNHLAQLERAIDGRV